MFCDESLTMRWIQRVPFVPRMAYFRRAHTRLFKLEQAKQTPLPFLNYFISSIYNPPTMNTTTRPFPAAATLLAVILSGWLGLSQCTRTSSVSNTDAPSHMTAAAKAIPAVVFIYTMLSDTSTMYGNRHSGSGVILSPDGYIITNHHVIKNGSYIHVALPDMREFQARLIGQDSTHDMALIKIDATDLPFMDIADSDRIRVGEQVMAIGNPYKLQSTVTSGIISAVNRSIDLPGNITPNFIQTDVPINLGNSGGALINLHGQLVGLNVAMISTSGQYEGYSFAMPSNLVRKVADDLKQFGSFQKSSLGISIRPASPALTPEFGMKHSFGVVVELITSDGAGDKAGLKPLDIVLAVNGKPVTSTNQFRGDLALFRPGEVLEFDLWRDRKFKKLSVKLN